LRYSAQYANFYNIVAKVTSSNIVISGAKTHPISVQCVAKSMPFDLLKSELQSCNPFRNASVTNKDGVNQIEKMT